MKKQTEELIEEYGIEVLTEILDLFEITKEEPVAWRKFALKYEIIKKSTKIIRPQMRKKHTTTSYKWGEDGVWGVHDVEPHDVYNIILENGRGEYVFQTRFTSLDIKEWRRKYA